MKLSEAKRRYIGKKFRIKHAERGYRWIDIIEGAVGTCTDIEMYWHGELENPADFTSKIISKRYFFKFRIDSPDTYYKWFSVNEIEPYKEDD